MRRANSTPQADSELCLVCGLCCDGTLFRDVELRPDDNHARLLALGLPITCSKGAAKRPARPGENQAKTGLKFTQPCVALDACGRCTIYDERPRYCREFDCALLKAVAEGRVASSAARRLIRNARKSAEHVRALLRRLGQADETLDLGLRFRRMQMEAHRRNLDGAEAALYGELTLAVHSLNQLLRRDFLPNPSPSRRNPP